MLSNDSYRASAAARSLHRAGEWDLALALLADAPDAPDAPDASDASGQSTVDVAVLRAQILVDRQWWLLDDPGPAREALDALDPGTPRAGFLRAQLAYTRLLFDPDPRSDDAQVADAGFRAAAQDESTRGWGTFWLGVVADNVHHDPATAQSRFDEALELCRAERDLLLESYVVRHLAGHTIERDRPAGELLLRRSLYLRSALGARPQVAAAQATLAGELPPGPERQTLREAAQAAAEELGLTWLKSGLAQTS
jgi:hypothetical protein